MEDGNKPTSEINGPEAQSKVVRTWPVARVIRLLKQGEGSVTALARRLGKNQGHLSRVVRGREVSSPVAAEVCRVLSAVLKREVRPCEVWPKLYAEDGDPKSTAYRRLPKAS